MIRSIGLRTEPTVRQTEVILSQVEHELAARGARVERSGPGRLRFYMPAPWRARRLGSMLAVRTGSVMVSAGSGELRRVRYHLHFTALRLVTAALSVVVAAIGWGWARTSLFNALVALWVVAFGIPYVVAVSRFRRIVEASARDVLERRKEPRGPAPEPAPGAGDTPPPAAT